MKLRETPGRFEPTSPGKYFYTDAQRDAKPQAVEVIEVNDTLCAAFPSPDGGRDLVAVEEMAGEWSTSRQA